MLWTFYDRPETGLPNTNNALEGLFSDLEIKACVHRGIGRDNRRKLIDEYISRKYDYKEFILLLVQPARSKDNKYQEVAAPNSLLFAY